MQFAAMRGKLGLSSMQNAEKIECSGEISRREFLVVFGWGTMGPLVIARLLCHLPDLRRSVQGCRY